MRNDFGSVEYLPYRSLTGNFKLVGQEGRTSYLVFLNGRYRADDIEHPLDVKES